MVQRRRRVCFAVLGLPSISASAVALVGLLAAVSVLCSTANANRGWEIGRLPSLAFLGNTDLVCAGTFEGSSQAYDKPVEWKDPGAWIADAQTRVAAFRIDHVIKGDSNLQGAAVQVVYVASLPPPPGPSMGRGAVFPDMVRALGTRRCLLQLLSHPTGPWEIRYGGDSYLALGCSPRSTQLGHIDRMAAT